MSFEPLHTLFREWKSISLGTLGLIIGVAFATSTSLAIEPPVKVEPDFFQSRVAPILEKHCLSCHGETGPRGKLDLTTHESLLQGGSLGPSIVPNHSEESLLIEMIEGDPPQMPKKAPRLSPGAVADVKTWINSGAEWPQGLKLRDRRLEGEAWWAFAPLKRPSPPEVKDKHWPKTPIDAFILKSLETSGLKPSVEADRTTLIRRLTYDLHGLPPSPTEIDLFLNDKDEGANERLIDRLLASPRYGERWGRHWLDIVHYGDTHGYDKDKRRDHAWPYRDYVIQSLNADLPYSRFIKDQVAGDVLFPGEPSSMIATGFIAAGPWDFVGHVELREGTVDKLKAQLNDRDDMLANTISTFQSMTVHCARCHDHKFDPILQKDYYKLQAVFAGVDRGDRAYSNKLMEEQKSSLEAEHKKKSERLQGVLSSITLSFEKHPFNLEAKQLEARISELTQKLASRPKRQTETIASSPTNGYHSEIHSQKEALAWVQVDLGQSLPIDFIRLVPARPIDFPDTPGFGYPPRLKVEVSDHSDFPPESSRLLETIKIESNDDEASVTLAKNVNARYVRVTADQLWKRTNDYIFALSELEVIGNGKNQALGKAVQALDSIEAGLWARTALVDGFDSRRNRSEAQVIAIEAQEQWSADLRQISSDRARLLESMMEPGLREQRDQLVMELKAIDASLQALESTELVYSVLPRQPRPIHLLRRGDVEQPGEPVMAGTLSCLPELESEFPPDHLNQEGTRRAALAQWLASTHNVLTWRSIVNRVWHFHFGRGIVDTPNDFGRNGSLPTHPELLDWLALEFLENGQSLKTLHRLILTSATYRQSSNAENSGEFLDASNQKLWRMNRQRLDAESVRDSVLAISGTLDYTMGGPGFELFKFKDDHSPIYDHTAPGVADHSGVRRRTIYRFVVRSVPNPFLESLDCADPSLSTPVRSTTITALQALALYNDPFITSQSQEFAKRLDREAKTIEEKIDLAYRLTFGRHANPLETSELIPYIKKHGLAAACRILLNTNEFMFID